MCGRRNATRRIASHTCSGTEEEAAAPVGKGWGEDCCFSASKKSGTNVV